MRKTPKTYRLSVDTMTYLKDLKALDCNKDYTETDIIQKAIQELWAAQKLLGINQPARDLARLTKAGD